VHEESPILNPILLKKRKLISCIDETPTDEVANHWCVQKLSDHRYRYFISISVCPMNPRLILFEIEKKAVRIDSRLDGYNNVTFVCHLLLPVLY
jgi:hypothetical protein